MRRLISKRKFLKTFFYCITSLQYANFSFSSPWRTSDHKTPENQITPSNLRSKRLEFAFRKRRIIQNNDGNDLIIRDDSEKRNPTDFINRRFSSLINTQVDAVSYCTGIFNSYTHKSEVSELRTRLGGQKELLTEYLIEKNTDSLKEAIKFCRNNKLDIFWSFRFNDTHDAQNIKELGSWKSSHKRLLIGKEGQKLYLGSNAWTALNYSKAEVRDKAFEIIKEVINNYDIDGIEIDFFRHLFVFKEVQEGKVASKKNLKKLTSFILKVRIALDEQSVKIQKPLLLLIRIPDSINYNYDLGLDIIEWLEEGYIDIIVAGGYFKLEPWNYIVEIGKKYNTPIYACLTPRRIHQGGLPGQKSEILKWRGEALNAWEAGIHGIYTFNRFQAKDKIFKEIGSPDLLKKLDKTDQETYICESCWFQPKRWLKDGNNYLLFNQ
jgi:hypothetical protein